MIYTLRTGGTAHPETSVLQHLTDFVTSGGILSGEDFKVSQQASPDLSVLVASGRAYVKGATSNTYPVRSTAIETVDVPVNASGNDRIDALVLYIDLSATANSESTNVAKLALVEGTSGASPVAPLDAEISSAIGAANPFTRLADILVANSATSITNANITDRRVTQTSRQGDGWEAFPYPVSFSSAQEVTVTGYDITGVIQKGDKFKCLNDDETKYFYIREVSTAGGDSTITFAGEVDLVSGGITQLNFSKIESPQGFKRGEIWYKARSYRNSALTLVDLTYTKVATDAINYDPNGNQDITTNYRYNVPVSGTYQISFHATINCDLSTSLTLLADVRKNGSTIIHGGRVELVANIVGINYSTGSDIVRLEKGDYIELFVYQSSTANRQAEVGALARNFLSIQFISV